MTIFRPYFFLDAGNVCCVNIYCLVLGQHDLYKWCGHLFCSKTSKTIRVTPYNRGYFAGLLAQNKKVVFPRDIISFSALTCREQLVFIVLYC